MKLQSVKINFLEKKFRKFQLIDIIIPDSFQPSAIIEIYPLEEYHASRSQAGKYPLYSERRFG